MGARNRGIGLSYRPARLQRLEEFKLPGTETSCIDLSVRIVTKSPKVGPLYSTYILHLSELTQSSQLSLCLSFSYRCTYLTEFDRLTEGLLQAEGPGVELDLQQINIYMTLVIPN